MIAFLSDWNRILILFMQSIQMQTNAYVINVDDIYKLSRK